MAACCCYFHGIYSLQRDERSIIIYSTKKVLHIFVLYKKHNICNEGYWNVVLEYNIKFSTLYTRVDVFFLQQIAPCNWLVLFVRVHVLIFFFFHFHFLCLLLLLLPFQAS